GDGGPRRVWDGQGAGVLEGRREDPGQVRGTGLIVAASQRPAREGEGQRVGGEGVAGAAVDVARELVEQDHQGQRPFGRLEPAVQLAAGGGEVRRLEPAGEHGVERRVRVEPLFGPGLFPVGDYVRNGYVLGHDHDVRPTS